MRRRRSKEGTKMDKKWTKKSSSMDDFTPAALDSHGGMSQCYEKCLVSFKQKSRII